MNFRIKYLPIHYLCLFLFAQSDLIAQDPYYLPEN